MKVLYSIEAAHRQTRRIELHLQGDTQSQLPSLCGPYANSRHHVFKKGRI